MDMSKVCEESFYGRPVYRLVDGDIEIVIDPWHGLSVVSLRFHGRELLWYDEQRYLSGNTYGIAVLFPTPNRIRDGMFRFDGEIYGPSRMHGFAKDVPFTVEALDCRTSGVRITGRYQLSVNAPVFHEFPFPLELVVAISLVGGRIRWDYTVRNTGSTPLGYGFALHPFFVRSHGVALWLGASQVMDADQSKLPTRTLHDVVGAGYDLRQGRPVSSLAGLDTVYYRSQGDFNCRISFDEIHLAVDMHASEEFRHFVVYVPASGSFFCVEPQTCSTDCHNLYDRGYREVSNLLLVAPGGERCGWVDMALRTCSVPGISN